MKSLTLVFAGLTLMLISCSKADTVSGTYNGTWSGCSQTNVNGTCTVSKIDDNSVKVTLSSTPEAHYVLTAGVNGISIQGTSAPYSLSGPYFTGSVSNNNILTWTWSGTSCDITFSGTK